MRENFPVVLLISNSLDFSSDYLITKIMERNIPYLRINSEDIGRWRISYKSTQPRAFLPRFEFGDQQFNLSNLKGVYFKKAPTVFEKFVSFQFQDFLTREAREFFEGIYLGIEANWINDIFLTYRAERKLFQLKLAKSIGFAVPNTLVTNDPEIINDFISDNFSIIKPISNGFVKNNDGLFSIFTNSVPIEYSIDCDKIIETPIYLQEKIDAEYDVRITVVGDEVFPVAIRKVDSDQVDWRRPNIKKEYLLTDIPTELKSACKQITRRLGLKFSAIDLMKRGDEYVFLEINPAGEWVWLEVELGIPISQHIIKELVLEKT